VINTLKLESPFWLLTYLLLIFVCTKVLKTRKIPDSSVVFPAVYLIGFVILSAFTETNLGTAIRHKGVLIILTLLLVATSESKEKDRIKGITI
jgi:Flp pilus assembly protein protease CpaA